MAFEFCACSRNEAKSEVPSGCLLEPEDRGADLLDRHVERIDRTVDPIRGGGRITARQRDRRLERHAGREQALDHRVVQVASDALAILQESDITNLVRQPCIVDSNTGRARQTDNELLVDVGKDLSRPLVGQIEVAEHFVTHTDRHAEERPHRRMVGREAGAVRMLAQVG